MNALENAMIGKARDLLEKGVVKRVVGWERGEFAYDPSPATFENAQSLESFVYNDFCGANLSKYLIKVSKNEGKTAVFLKPCDTYSLNQLIKEHRVDREKIYAIGIECQQKLDHYAIEKIGIDGIREEQYDGDEAVFHCVDGEKRAKKEDVVLLRCLTCKSKKFAIADDTVVLHEMTESGGDRFEEVEKLSSMTADERFAFWQKELSRCIRCNACRNVCPACTCIKCVFDNPKSGVAAKANDVPFEEQLFHIIRAFHVSGRCTDCGECSRVCPERIPLHLLNRKFILDINENYGEYQAGEESEGKTPLTSYQETDVEPGDAVRKGEDR